ncbi:hypothetical protein [Bradyrhizobium yuanmingense]|uniref:hypothetical protein n=1 Tax=Bradyrhizobium yuanmingense TaxID=108015 RepID=UPI001CD4DBE1|nr:hypothetical protein [Bradyrhizobium yuanmingense]MCA1530595.1 hypothetical protein [Bradyrhizobium yuanmingense]
MLQTHLAVNGSKGLSFLPLEHHLPNRVVSPLPPEQDMAPLVVVIHRVLNVGRVESGLKNSVVQDYPILQACSPSFPPARFWTVRATFVLLLIREHIVDIEQPADANELLKMRYDRER